MATEKVGTTSFQFLSVNPSAQASSLGESISSRISGSESLFLNPAGLASVEHMDLSMSYFNYFFDIQTMALTGGYKLKNIGTIGLQCIYTNYGKMDITSVEYQGTDADGNFNPGYTGETFNPYHMVLGLTYAKSITSNFSFGLTAKYVKEDLDVSSDKGDIAPSQILFDGGLIYKTGFRSIQTSAVVRNFGGDIVYYEDEFPAPQTLIIGISADLFSNGDALLFTTNDNHKLMFAFDLIAPRDYDQQYNLGLEYSLWNSLFFRTGYKINYDSEGFCCGTGIKYKGFQWDYSFNNYSQYLDNIHRFSMGVTL